MRFIDGLNNADAMPALERMIRFAGARQRIIAHNVANLSTPNFQAVDVDVQGFRSALGEAIERRRKDTGGLRGDLEGGATRDVKIAKSGGLTLEPAPVERNVLFHDRNNRDLERTMQDLAENVAAFRVASELLKSQHSLLRTAIAERV